MPAVSAAARDINWRFFWYGAQIMVRIVIAWFLAASPELVQAFVRNSATPTMETTLQSPSARKKRGPQDDNAYSSLSALSASLFPVAFSHPLADFELHLAGFLVGIDHDVIAVQNFAVENLQRQWILDQLLNRAL